MVTERVLELKLKGKSAMGRSRTRGFRWELEEVKM
jgi:hypothetical protein